MKVYKVTLHGPGGNYVIINPEFLKEDMEEENKTAKSDLEPDEYKPFNPEKDIQEIKKLKVGEKWEHDLGSVECLEIAKEKYDKLPEFQGW